MSDKTAIEWTDATWNPIRGCSRVSDGCRHCYAETVANRFKGPGQPYEGLVARGGQWNGTIKWVGGDVLTQPLRWAKPRRIFVNSMSDLFHEAMTDEMIDQVFAVMASARHHTFQVLTKRPERMRYYMATKGRMLAIRNAARALDRGNAQGCDRFPLPNVWLGVSVEDQKAADERIPHLLATPAAVRWISAEPLLGPVDLFYRGADGERYSWLRESFWRNNRVEHDPPRIGWVVVGGESGPQARPMHPQWARDLRDQCAAAGVPFLFKQWGEWVPRSACYHTFKDGKSLADIDPGSTRWPCLRLTYRGNNGSDIAHAGDDGDEAYMQRIGKKSAGRLLDGVQHDGYPAQQPAGGAA